MPDEVFISLITNYNYCMFYHWNRFSRNKDDKWFRTFHLKRVWFFMFTIKSMLEL